MYLLKVADLTEEEDKFNKNVSNYVERCCDGITKRAFKTRICGTKQLKALPYCAVWDVTLSKGYSSNC